MQSTKWSRRAVMIALSGAAAGLGAAREAGAQTVKWSSGSERPKTKAPARATDCHHHIYDARFPIDPTATLRPGDATVADYRQLQARIGTTRNVIVQPSTYGVDNRLLVEALGQFGARARGVAVVNTEVSDAELKRLHKAGVRGIRFNLAQRGATTVEMIDPLSKRVAALGWHIQINAPADTILAAKDIWVRVPCPIVFDHLAHVPEPDGVRHPVFALANGLVQQGKAWIKLSGAYADTKIGPPSYADSSAVAQAYVKAAPERLVWGSDWPHPSERDSKPDDALLFDLLAGWAPDVRVRTRILVDNPAKLYGFA
jgi:predicted TIM-barrel fold metal-dependent hydrolase